MTRRLIPLLLFICGAPVLRAQEPALTVETARQLVGVNEAFEVTYTLQNVDGDFSTPDFAPLELLAGPQTMSSFQMINGRTTRSQSYTYTLRAPREGSFVLPSVSVAGADGPVRSEALKITADPTAPPAPRVREPRGTMPGWEEFFGRPRAPEPAAPRTRRRRKTYRI